MCSHVMGENRSVSSNHAPLTDFHSKSSNVFVGSSCNKMQSEFKLKRKNKPVNFKGLTLFPLPAYKALSICINSGHYRVDTYVCM